MFVGNLDLFDDINILTQQKYKTDLGYQKDDPLNKEEKF